MQPYRPTNGPPPTASVGPRGTVEALGARASTLLQRIMEVERTLAAYEWWQLARVFPEAQALSEIASLLAVARGELEHFMAQFFGRPIPASDPADEGTAGPARTDDPAWVQASRQQAAALLRMAAMALPAMQQYARTLYSSAERLGMPMAAIDPLSIVADRMGEAYDLLLGSPSS